MYSKSMRNLLYAISLDQSLEDYDEASFEAKIRTLREIIVEFSGDNPKLSVLLH